MFAKIKVYAMVTLVCVREFSTANSENGDGLACTVAIGGPRVRASGLIFA